MATLLLFLVVLSLLVFVHELGHFLVAKKMGMKVEEFGFGFPPRAIGVKKGDTTYSINWIPLGGFVRIKGESGENRTDHDSFASKKAWQRFFVLVAGVAMNLVLAAVLLSIVFMIGLPTAIEETLPANARVQETTLTVATVVKDSPAAQAGIQEGDVIVSLDGRVFEKADEARAYIGESASDGVQVLVKSKKDDGYYTYDLTAEALTGTETIGIGVGFLQIGVVTYPFFEAIGQGVKSTIEFTKLVVEGFVGLIVNLVTGKGVGVELSGPVGIAVLTGQVAALGFAYLLQFTALLSINLAVINILPFPALDGGRVLFLLIEKLRGQPVSQKVEGMVHNAGFLLLMVLVVFVTFKDIVNFF